MQSPEEFESKVLMDDEELDTEVKINPAFYIHHTLIKAQQALVQEDYRAGFAQYRIIMEHLEMLCKAANLVESDYDDKIKAFEKNLKEEEAMDVRNMKVANKKFELLSKNVFEKQSIYSELKDTPNKFPSKV